MESIFSELQAYLIFSHITHVVILQIKGNTLHRQKVMIRFAVVVWKQTSNISKARLYSAVQMQEQNRQMVALIWG